MNCKIFNIVKIVLIACSIFTICYAVHADNEKGKDEALFFDLPLKRDDSRMDDETLFSWSVTEKTESAVVHASIPWEMTNIVTKDNTILSWSVSEDDLWSFNTYFFPYGHSANGIEGIPALLGYIFPGENLGRLIGSIGGSGRMFSMGVSGETIIREGEGGNYIYLTINDELRRISGEGFNDNEGELLVTFKQTPRIILNIDFIYCEKWPGFKETIVNLEEVLIEENIKDEVRVIKLSHLQEAKDLKFIGSPTIRINNKDIDPNAKETGEYCLKSRSYSFKGKVSGWPDKELIRNAIRKALQEIKAKERNYERRK